MKKLVVPFLFLLVIQCSTKTHITESTDIEEIENYLKNAHPDDQYKLALKKRLVKLKNESWMQGSRNIPTMTARPLDIDKYMVVKKKRDTLNVEHFNALISEREKNHDLNTAKVLSELFNSRSLKSDEIILMVNNTAKCDAILSLKGKINYDFPLKATEKSAVVIKKGNYKLSSNVCAVKYNSEKSFTKHTEISLAIQQ